jgi:tetratricopeptide (TPR) repeat protein
MIELNVRFSSPSRVSVGFKGTNTAEFDFRSESLPKAEDLQELGWYLEKYLVYYSSEPDDSRAKRLEENLEKWGRSLFDALRNNEASRRWFDKFLEVQDQERQITIFANDPAILSLPWELLREREFFLFETPRITIRRCLYDVAAGRDIFEVEPQPKLRMLFVTSRPDGAGFIDPRADALPVLNAIEQVAGDRIEVEFLRPATYDNLKARLESRGEHRGKLPIHILHFDGHGSFRRQKNANDADRDLPKGELAQMRGRNDEQENMGYLLFEKADGTTDLRSAEEMSAMLHTKKISLVVLSACQSAMAAGEDPLSCVAARLTSGGLPAVIAMTYSVLVVTTQKLFESFYRNLAYGERVGEALENARQDLYDHPERLERQRGQNRVIMRLQDWFLPALYQVGNDGALFQVVDPPQPPLERGEKSGSNLRELQEAGFWGRSRELWAIERAYVRGTRRITISGFGGMGKTYLAEETGRWLLRTGMFARVCFISFADFQGVDPVSYAVSVLATVLDTNLIDGAAATRALREQAVLVILDNLETISSPLPPLVKGGKEDSDQDPFVSGKEDSEKAPLSKGGRGDQALLDIAKEWSEAGNSRVLLTTRAADLQHSDYPNQGSLKHIPLPLRGLSEGNALDYFQSLIKLPPEPQFGLPPRDGLLELFKLLDYHPLSLGLLAGQLKQRRALEVHRELAQLVADTPNNPLLASLNLSVSRLDPKAQEWIKRLGVFQGGAFEDDLMAITEIAETEWHELRTQLEATGLIQAESLSHLGVGVPFLKFHPTLAPAMWSRLTEPEQQQLLIRHRQRYYQLSAYLYDEDEKNPFFARAIAQRELPNLLYAVRGSIAAGEDFAVDFMENVNKFLYFFGLNQDREKLTEMAQHIGGEVRSQTWFITRSNTGEQLWDAGRYAEAEAVFQEILTGLGATPSYDRCYVIGNLGLCYESMGHPELAAATYRLALEVAGQLEQNNSVKRQMGRLQTSLGDVLTNMGNYDRARESYEASLAIKKEIGGDRRGEAVVQGQLGTLARKQNNIPEAIQRYQEALEIFQQLNEPAMEATAWHQLGNTFYELRQWEAAEQTYRQSAQIKEAQGNLTGAARTWNQLAMVSEGAGKLTEAEAWYRKAIAADRKQGDRVLLSQHLSNLADLLQQFPNRLNEAQQLAEESLAIKETLDPAAAQIWATYGILAEISDQQGDPAKANEYRRLSRTARANFAGTEYELRQHAHLIEAVVRAIHDAEFRQQLESQLQETDPECQNIVWNAIRQILNGQRDEDILCKGLDDIDSQIVLAILDQVKR